MWFFFFQAEDGIRDVAVTGVQTCALPIFFKRVRRWLPDWRFHPCSALPPNTPCQIRFRADSIFSATVIFSMRSEEHTSELQSRLHLVCRLLLEKKKRYSNSSSSRVHPQRSSATSFAQST